MILTNIGTVPGKTIVEHYGLVQSSTVRAKHLGRDIMAGLKILLAGNCAVILNCCKNRVMKHCLV